MRFKQVRIKAEKYTIKQHSEAFSDDAAVLADIFRKRYPDGLTCEKCARVDMFTPVTGRRSYACPCGFQVYPTAGSICHKSPTPLKTWYLAIFYIIANKNGVAALELMRHIGVTYKCAWRMTHQIRKLMTEELPPMTGTVEMDETYVGGKRPGKRVRGAAGKAIVVWTVERQGNVAPFVVERANAEIAKNLLDVTTDPSAKIITDEYGAYHGLKKAGYDYETINHGQEEYVRGDVHTNTIEGFWSQMKRSIDGTHHGVSKKHLQASADEYAFWYDRRHSVKPMFSHLVSALNEQPAS